MFPALTIFSSLIYRRIFWTTIFIGVICVNASAQKLAISFKITTQKNDPIPNASIKIINWPESLMVEQKVADKDGLSSVSLLLNTAYIITVSAVNHLPKELKITLTGEQTFFNFSLDPITRNLDTVTVQSKKPLMTQEDDKLIVDPENLVASSSSGFEVIEKIPGLFMDQDGNIYLNSMTPATVHVNGRELRMSAADVASMLKSLPPNSISKIEILRTPSARYDASGGGGIVNVVLKKGIKLGLTGSINAGIQQGTYGNKFIGFSLNNNSGKKSSFFNFNYSRRNSYEKIITNRLFAADTILYQDAFTKYPGDAFHSSYGQTWFLGKKWEVEIDGSVNLNNSKNNSDNNSQIKKVSSNANITSNLNTVSNKSNSFNISKSIETKMKIDTIGSEWTNDISYRNVNNNNDQHFSTVYFVPQIPFTSGDGMGESHYELLTASSDLLLKLPKKLTFEAGLKTSFHQFKNETNYFREANGSRAKDVNRTNTFNYKENINAAYVQAAKTFGKDIILKAGTRLENTNMKGRQIIPSDTSFNIDRTDLFPYVYLSKGIMKILGYQLRAYLVYRRSIQRPVYEQLNPFARYIDQYLSEVGNPSLQPQFTQNYEFNISFEDRPVLAVGVRDTRDIFTNVIYQADTSMSHAYRTYDNLGINKEWYFRALGALPPGGKYFFVLGAQYNHNFYSGLYENKPLSYKRGSWMMFTYHTLKLDKRSQIAMNGFVRFNGLLQLTEVETFGTLNFNLNRRFLKDKLTVTLSANDVFFSNKYNFSIQQGTVNAYGLRQNDTRRLGVNIRYNFGIRKKEENKNFFDVESPEKQ